VPDRMRIVFTSHYALPHLGGIEVAIDGLARELAARGHDVVHVASAALRDGERERMDPDPGYRVIRVPALNGAEGQLGVPYPVFSPRLAGVLRRELPRADVIHAHGYLYLSSLAALGFARARHPNAARVLTEHVGRVGYESAAVDLAERGATATLGRLSVRLAEAIVILNEKVRAELAPLAGNRPLVWIGNGVDAARYRPAAAEERAALRERLGWDDRPRALFVGRLVAKKGVDLAVAAAARSRAELVVVGPGEQPAAAGGVTFMGARSPDAVAELYRAADVFVLPSRGEGFPVTAQEALASGLPVILLDDPGYAPYVNGAAGAVRLAEPRAESIAAAIDAVIADPEARERAGEAAAAHARDHFSWSHAADEHERLYAALRG
jgi:D-inositol-3-phosphate glycosyltransferase